jgi:lipopolysaccharide transport system ATP-binding protein
MSAILRLTQETIVLDQGKIAMRAPTPEAVDYYLNLGLSKEGERIWSPDEFTRERKIFRPVALRVLNSQNKVVDTVNSTDGFSIEFEYELGEAISGLRVGLYMMTTRGEFVFTTFDTDDPQMYEENTVRPEGRYISRCSIPPNLLNEGRFVLGINASTYRIKRIFQDDKVLTFNVDATGAPGTHWPEKRLGPVRPNLDWTIEKIEN